jgi:hypothetical protein
MPFSRSPISSRFSRFLKGDVQMKQARCFWIGAAVLAALVTTLLLTLPTLASRSPSTSSTSPISSISLSHSDYLVVLPTILPNPDEIPPNLSPDQADQYANRLTYRQAQPVLAELKRLRTEGKIASFQVQSGLHGVILRGITPGALEQLSRLQGVAAVLPTKDEPPICAAAAAEAFPDQLMGLSRMAADTAMDVQAANLAPQATDPSIDVYNLPGGSYGNIMGQTTSNTAVTLRILRGGRVVASKSTTSNSSGNYYFYPTWQQCPTIGYDWSLRPGDVVEVTAHGSTVSTVVAHLSAWVDPVANTVAGQTDPGRSALAQVYDSSGDLCNGTIYNQTGSVDGSGSFSIDFSGQVDFDRLASATVYARDANGNSTYADFYAYRIAAEFNSNDFWGYIKPETDFTATLSRTGSIVSTDSGKSSATGYYDSWFTDTIQSGDIVQVSGGGVNIQYTATNLDVMLDHATDQATGVTGANRRVQAWFYKRDWGVVQTTCSWDNDCASTTADGSGAFTLDTKLDLARGDYADMYVYDAEGNYQYAPDRPVPAIIAGLTWDEVWGYWGDPNADYVAVTLKDSSGTVKDTDSWVWVDSWDGEFYTWMWSSIIPTDIIEVTDGTVTETMTVQNLTARLDGGSGHLTGNAYNGHLIVDLEDFRRDSGWWGYCHETNVTGGNYDLTFSGAQVGGQDDAEVWNTGPDGHYTYRYSSAFSINAQKGSDEIWGYSETPDAQVTITLRSGVTTKAIYTTTSENDGYYDAWLSNSVPVTITQGDTLQVQTGDGDSASLTIPELTANTDAVNNRVYGKSPAGKSVRARVRRHYNYGWYSYSRYTTADGSGNYSAAFDGLYWSYDCSAVDVGHQCAQPAAYYYDTADHSIWVEGAEPPPVGPDIYEDDNTYATANAYDGAQSHTFHTYTDTDWISFTVPAEDVTNAVLYRIETSNLGWGMDTYLYLYDTDGSTLLEENDDWYDLESRIEWTPPVTGTYYVLVEPYDSDNTEYCDAVYDLMILPVRSQIYLPLVLREY